MTQTYHITGMTCSGCEHKVRTILSKIAGVKNVFIDLSKGAADIEMEQLISTGSFKTALKDYPKYQLSEAVAATPVAFAGTDQIDKSWLETFKPILLIFGYITIVSIIAALSDGHFNLQQAMRIFMAGFFLVFSFFKLLDLDGFVESYSTYDIIAKRFRSWGYLYVFIELGLGIAFAANISPVVVNYITLAVMLISIIGVLQSVLNKRKINCACLGAVFNLPMSTVTIIEDSLMIIMSIAMIMMMA